MKINLLYSRDPSWTAELDIIVEQRKRLPKRPVHTEQAPSTLRNLARDPSQDEAWKNRPIPYAQAQVAKSAQEMAQFERKMTPDEFSLIEGMRRRPKNSEGQSELSSAMPERRQAAASAFTCSPPAELTDAERSRISQISPYTPPPPVPPREKKSWWGRLFGRPDQGAPESKERWGWINGFTFGNRAK